MSVVGQARDGEHAVQMFHEQKPNVTLMDLRMPVIGGVAAIRAIRHESPGASVLTTYLGEECIHRALKSGLNLICSKACRTWN